ncbi:MAG: rhomboid family intramembrane serine protease [Candidatus Eisenbacteria bacterium]
MFFPIGDDNSRRQRIPFVNVALIALNALAFVAELAANSQGGLARVVQHWSLIPADYAAHAGLGGPVPWTLVTSMFLHAGWAHFLGNMVYLGIFGDNVESALGHVRYLAFYLASGVVGGLAHIVTSPASTLPTLGASAAISGVLAAYVLYFPRNRVLVWFWFRILAVPALVVIGLWAILQLISGAGTLVAAAGGGGTAYLAHVGGFAGGLALAALFMPKEIRAERRDAAHRGPER